MQNFPQSLDGISTGESPGAQPGKYGTAGFPGAPIAISPDP
jgi:hypothetical protein